MLCLKRRVAGLLTRCRCTEKAGRCLMLLVDRSGTQRRGRPYALACASLLACAVAFATPQHPPETTPNRPKSGVFLSYSQTHHQRGYYPGLSQTGAHAELSLPQSPPAHNPIWSRPPATSNHHSLPLSILLILDLEGLHLFASHAVGEHLSWREPGLEPAFICDSCPVHSPQSA